MKTFSELIPKVPAVEQKTCQIHGSFESRNIIANVWTKCPECTKAEEAAIIAEEEAEKRKERRLSWENKLGDAGIPERFRTRTLDTFLAETEAQKYALSFAREYAENFQDVLRSGRCAIFIGNVGTGKTHLAAGIGLRIMGAQNRTVLFITVARAVMRVKDTWNRNSRETQAQAISAMTYPDLLILDEAGVQFGSDVERNILFDIMNDRYEKRKPTIIIANLTKDELVPFIGERVMDRLKEGGGQVITFNWESHRGK